MEETKNNSMPIQTRCEFFTFLCRVERCLKTQHKHELSLKPRI